MHVGFQNLLSCRNQLQPSYIPAAWAYKCSHPINSHSIIHHHTEAAHGGLGAPSRVSSDPARAPSKRGKGCLNLA